MASDDTGPQWPITSLEDLLRYTLRPLEDRAHTKEEVERERLSAALAAAAWDRAEIQMMVDRLAREFAQAGRPNTVAKLREMISQIEGRPRLAKLAAWANSPNFRMDAGLSPAAGRVRWPVLNLRHSASGRHGRRAPP